MTLTNPSVKIWDEADPRDYIKALPALALFKAVTYQSATLTLGTVPANSRIVEVCVVRTTRWTTITTFEIGKSGDTDWLATTAQANVNGAIDAGEDGNVEVISVNKVVTSDTDIVLTLNQGAASAGAGYVMVKFEELDR